MRNAVTGVLAAAVALGAVLAAPPPQAVADPSGVVRWSPDLTAGETAGVEVVDGTARLAPERAAADLSLPADGHGDAGFPGLLTLPPRAVDRPVGRVEAVVDEDEDGASDDVGVDVRGMRSDGSWTEWLPADPPVAPSTAAQVAFPDPVTQVQARLVLTPGPVEPAVHGLTLTAYPAPPGVTAAAPRRTLSYRVFATREGLVGGTTANGHVIAKNDLFVALPSRRALSPRNTADYSVKVCASPTRCVFAPVWDVGPWNTRDDYWNPGSKRQMWRDLPQGMPESQAAKQKGYNHGKDQYGRKVRNLAGIDLSNALFWGALGLKDNSWVTVDYLWTGNSPLAVVRVEGQTDVLGAPDPAAGVVGLVADQTAVPLQCRTGPWLRIGSGQFLPLMAVPEAPGSLPTCTG
jgi:hypothetical protein